MTWLLFNDFNFFVFLAFWPQRISARMFSHCERDACRVVGLGSGGGEEGENEHQWFEIYKKKTELMQSWPKKWSEGTWWWPGLMTERWTRDSHRPRGIDEQINRGTKILDIQLNPVILDFCYSWSHYSGMKLYMKKTRSNQYARDFHLQIFHQQLATLTPLDYQIAHSV